MNFVEQRTWESIKALIEAIDPQREGWAVDVGIGDGDYYFEWFANLGYKTVAVEPLPTEAARKAVNRAGVAFYEVALDVIGGQTTMYTAGSIHSLYSGLWGSSVHEHTVDTATLDTILAGIDRITALKLDIEGAEGMVLRQLDRDKLPAVLSFEFGGVWSRVLATGSWSPERWQELQNNLLLLHKFGYTNAIVVSSGDRDRLQEVALPVADVDTLFPLDTNWGNIIVWRESHD